MSRITIEIPTELHRAVKSYTAAKGETIKDFFVEAASQKLKETTTMRPDKITKPKKIKPIKKKKNDEYITEEEAERMLIPYWLRMIDRIKKGEEKVYTEEEFFAKLKANKKK